MSLLKDIFGRKRKKTKCAVCGEPIQNDFKTKYLKLNGCFGLHMLHYECDKKINNLEKSIKGE